MVGLPQHARSLLWDLPLTVVGTLPAVLRAARDVDPVALVTSLGELPRVLAGLPPVLLRVDELMGGIEVVVGDVAVAVNRTLGTVDGLVSDVAAIPPRVTALVGDVEAIPRRVEAIMGSVEGTVAAVGPVLAGADKAVAGGRRTVSRADALVESISTPVDALVPVLTLLGGLEVELLTRLGTLVAGLEPLLGLLSSVEPAAAAEVAEDAAALVASVPELLRQVETGVLPALQALRGLVPAVEGLTHDVERLGAIVNGLPGAGRLMRRGDERAK